MSVRVQCAGGLSQNAQRDELSVTPAIVRRDVATQRRHVRRSNATHDGSVALSLTSTLCEIRVTIERVQWD